jgi:hypothetical protein
LFPVKKRLENIVKKTVDEKDYGEWVDKLAKKPELEFYHCSQPSITMNKWYELWNYERSKLITDIIRLSCGSLTVRNDRFGNAGTLSGICSAC